MFDITECSNPGRFLPAFFISNLGLLPARRLAPHCKRSTGPLSEVRPGSRIVQQEEQRKMIKRLYYYSVVVFYVLQLNVVWMTCQLHPLKSQ